MKQLLQICLCLAWAFQITGAESSARDENIVIQKEASPRIRLAARELRDYFLKVTGRKMDLLNVPLTGKVNIILAETGRGILPETMERKLQSSSSRDVFYLKTEGKNLYIGGRTSLGVLFGVYTYLEKYMGIRWLFPGKEGEFYREKRDFRIGQTDDFQEPSFPFRMMLPVGASRHKLSDTYIWFARNKIECDMMENVFKQPGLKRFLMEERSTFPRSTGHDFFMSNVPEEKYFKTHPEYFCLVNGRRIPPKGKNRDAFNGHTMAQACTSHPDVKKLCAAGLIDFYNRWGRESILLMGMGDNCNVWCECPECSKLILKDDPRNNTTRVFRFFSDVAEIVYREKPDADIHAWAYTGCRDPEPSMKIDPRITVLYCDYGRCHAHAFQDERCSQSEPYRKQFEKWLKISPKVAMREYLLTSLADYAPLEYVLAEDLKYFHSRGIIGWVEEVFGPEGIYNAKQLRKDLFVLKNNWRSRWQMLYLASKLLWDVKAAPEPILDEANELYFGRTWPVMKQYRAFMRMLWERAPGHSFYGVNIPRAAFCLAEPGAQQKLEELLNEAEKLSNGDKILAGRIQLERQMLKRFWIDSFNRHRQNTERFVSSRLLESPVTIDGDFKEKGWITASWISEMKTWPDGKKPESGSETYARIAHSSSGWYLAVEAMEKEIGKLQAACRLKDSTDLFRDDTIEVFLASQEFPEKYFQIAVNPAGTLFDAEWINGKLNAAYESGCSVRTKVLKDRWQAEFYIPAAPMGGKIKDGDQWKINVCRSRRSVVPTESTTLNGVGFHAPEVYTRLISGKPVIRNGGMDRLTEPKRSYPGWTLTSRRIPESWFPGQAASGAEIGVVSIHGDCNYALRVKKGSVFQKILFSDDKLSPENVVVAFDARGTGQLGFAIYRYDKRKGSKFIRAENFPPVNLSAKWKTFRFKYKIKPGEAIATAFNISDGELVLDNVNLITE